MTDKKGQTKQAQGPAATLTIRVVGPSIRSGRIPVPELLTICQHAQAAVNRQAEAIEGRQTMHPGRKLAKVEEECTLELVGLGRGSAVLCFEQAMPQPNLPVYGGRHANLGEEAIAGVADALRLLALDEDAPVDPGVLQSLGNLSSLVIGRRVRRIDWKVPRRPGRRPSTATIDRKLQTRIARRLEPAPTKAVTVDGVLEMVDFKPGDYRCRVHPSVGQPIACAFSATVEDDVFLNLRRPVRVKGVASINRHTGRTESLAITEITPLDPLQANPEAFFKGANFAQLVAEQGVDPVSTPRDLQGLWRDEDDVDAFVAEVYRQRA